MRGAAEHWRIGGCLCCPMPFHKHTSTLSRCCVSSSYLLGSARPGSGLLHPRIRTTGRSIGPPEMDLTPNAFPDDVSVGTCGLRNAAICLPGSPPPQATGSFIVSRRRVSSVLPGYLPLIVPSSVGVSRGRRLAIFSQVNELSGKAKHMLGPCGSSSIGCRGLQGLSIM